jgi:hypothetical protein
MRLSCIVTDVSEESISSISIVEDRKKEASGLTKMLVTIYQTTRYQIQDGNNHYLT